MTIAKQTVAQIALVAVAMFALGQVRAQSTKPLSEKDLVKLIELQIDDGAVVSKLQKEGVAFAVDDETLERLKNAGASDPVLEAVRTAAKASTKPSSPPGKAVTYEDVLKLLELGIDERQILDRLAKSPTLFTLDATQVSELKKAGASEKLLAAMAGNRPQAEQTGDITDFAIILDCSGSMMEKTREGPTKMTVAKKVVTDLVQKIPDGLRLTFVIYGHDEKLKCADSAGFYVRS